MLTKLNHIAVVVPDLVAASENYKTRFNAEVSESKDLPDHGVTTIFVKLADSTIELLHPLGEDSPVAKFLKNNPRGGIHHLCYEVDDIGAAIDKLVGEGAKVLGGGAPKIGAHGKPVVFLDPRDFTGVLIELEQH
ncbi:MAG: methylmalonyl-CoA epimerase [Pseudomonadales bacterium]|nr:methylmalonyl-CoA epimerase [Pseudomonadales bacterium]